jgi:hypothetical protein
MQLISVLRRHDLEVELLEPRLLLTAPAKLIIPLDAELDAFGKQIVTVQAYQDKARAAFGIFDTGASSISFSAADQTRLLAAGTPIPIQIPAGAHADGVGGSVTGDVSQPGTILAAGLHAATMSFDARGVPRFSFAFGSGGAAAAPVQAFVGTPTGSPRLPTVTGTPILRSSPDHPNGLAALVKMQGGRLDFSPVVAGLSLAMPDLYFVDAGTPLSGQANTTGPVQIPLSMMSNGATGDVVSGVTEDSSPIQNDVTALFRSTAARHLSFLFDTGAQLTVLSTAVATALGVDLAHPMGSLSLTGVGGTIGVPRFALDALDLPLVDGRLLEFTHVPIFVMDLAPGLDGILGMNLWNSANEMLYDPHGSATLSVTFLATPTHGTGNPGPVASLQNLGLPFLGAIEGAQVPELQTYTSQIQGQVIVDYDGNGLSGTGEPGLAGVTVFLDLNHNGTFDPGDLSTTTDEGGNYWFRKLARGTYQVREIVPPRMRLIAPEGDLGVISIGDDQVAIGPTFANVYLQPTMRASYVYDLYGSILHRAPEEAGLNHWTQALQEGATHLEVAQAIWESAEHRADQVTAYYLTYLHRTVEPGGLAYWVGKFLSGATEADVQSGILSSGEYQAAHPDDDSFLAGLYTDVLGRSGDAAGMASWVQALHHGVLRDVIESAFLNSPEFLLRTIDGYYSQLLHRQASQAEEQIWLEPLLRQSRRDLNSTAEAVLSSEEYYNWSKQNVLSA